MRVRHVRDSSVFVLALGILLQGCGGGGPAGPGDDEGRGEGRLGPEGGIIETRDGNARALIPAGALSASTLLEIRRLREDEIPQVLFDRRRASDSHRFGPDGLRFLKPVRIEIFFDAEKLPPGVELSDLTIGKVNAAGQLEQLTDVQIILPPSTGRAALQVTRTGLGGLVSSFSPFAVWVDDSPAQTSTR